MTVEQGPVKVLGHEEAWDLMSSVSLGRLVTSVSNQLEIFPVNFVTQNGTLLFRTAEGTKLFSTVMNDRYTSSRVTMMTREVALRADYARRGERPAVPVRPRAATRQYPRLKFAQPRIHPQGACGG